MPSAWNAHPPRASPLHIGSWLFIRVIFICIANYFAGISISWCPLPLYKWSFGCWKRFPVMTLAPFFRRIPYTWILYSPCGTWYLSASLFSKGISWSASHLGLALPFPCENYELGTSLSLGDDYYVPELAFLFIIVPFPLIWSLYRLHSASST